jgi:hypothetical protein
MKVDQNCYLPKQRPPPRHRWIGTLTKILIQKFVSTTAFGYHTQVRLRKNTNASLNSQCGNQSRPRSRTNQPSHFSNSSAWLVVSLSPFRATFSQLPAPKSGQPPQRETRNSSLSEPNNTPRFTMARRFSKTVTLGAKLLDVATLRQLSAGKVIANICKRRVRCPLAIFLRFAGPIAPSDIFSAHAGACVGLVWNAGVAGGKLGTIRHQLC